MNEFPLCGSAALKGFLACGFAAVQCGKAAPFRSVCPQCSCAASADGMHLNGKVAIVRGDTRRVVGLTERRSLSALQSGRAGKLHCGAAEPPNCKRGVGPPIETSLTVVTQSLSHGIAVSDLFEKHSIQP